MNTNKLLGILKTSAFLFIIITMMTACNLNKKNENRENSREISQTGSEKELIPDSIVQFLITSAATDFHNYQQPSDFRNIKIGYLESPDNKKQYALCGEFLSKNKEWDNFATIKTSGYEQYIGNQSLSFCNKMTEAQIDQLKLLAELKNKFHELEFNK